ncbi:MAG TPA: VOC family protein [Pedobacter sp.]
MIKELWFNLPVKNIQVSLDFYTSLGFTENSHFPKSDTGASLFAGSKNIVIMLFTENVFKGFSQSAIPNAQESTQVLLSIDAESREEVDHLARTIKQSGGSIFAEPGDNQGWMYGCGFADPDGHRWTLIYMDMSKMPQ